MQTRELAANLIALKSSVLNAQEEATARTTLFDDVMARQRAANAKQNADFENVKTAADWEKFRDGRLAAMRKSFASAADPIVPAPLPVDAKPAPGNSEITGTYEGDGFRIANLVIASRAGLPVTANLYLPAAPSNNMPGILIVTSHHNAKMQGELQDMGWTWARSGCAVIVADNIGYGERRQQSYGGREDYRWRYHIGMQLHTVGESQMGWMVADLRRALDVLLAQPGVDPKRIIVLGSVAGGGDISGVLAAMDKRVTCVVPFNYGSASARKAADGASWVNYINGGDWDTVRCLRNSGRDGFNPWVILSAMAPRHMIFAKEFSWQPAGDEGCARITRMYELCGARDRFVSITGFGEDAVRDKPRSPANNIAAAHRKEIYPVLTRWFNMPAPAETVAKRLSQEITCLTPAARAHWQPRMVNEVLAELGAKQMAAAHAALAALPAEKRKEHLRQVWGERLGNVTPIGAAEVKRSETTEGKGFVAERLLLSVEPAIPLPVVLLKPRAGAEQPAARLPVVICVAQDGKNAFVSKRALEIAELLTQGVAVCLVDVRGTGETRPDENDRYWYSAAVDTAARDLAMGQTILGARVRDLRGVLRHLQSRADIDGKRVAVWGESFAPVNAPKFVDPPMKTEVSPLQAEPMGATAAILLALFEDDVQAVLARGGVTGFAALLDGPASHVALDAIVPDALATGDLSEVLATLAPRPVRLEALVDGRNRLAGEERINHDLATARAAYQAHPDNLTLTPATNDNVAEWVARVLK